jgi:cell wall-associated NlpC family hydrolase
MSMLQPWKVLPAALVLALLGCQSTAVFTHRATQAADADAGTPLRNRLLQEVQRWIGTPYCYGGLGSGCMDCSGFVQQLFAALGYQLPRTTAEQACLGEAVHAPEIGDLVFVHRGGRYTHVGVYLGSGRIAHASSSRGVVIDPVEELHRMGSLHYRRILR